MGLHTAWALGSTETPAICRDSRRVGHRPALQCRRGSDCQRMAHAAIRQQDRAAHGAAHAPSDPAERRPASPWWQGSHARRRPNRGREVRDAQFPVVADRPSRCTAHPVRQGPFDPHPDPARRRTLHRCDGPVRGGDVCQSALPDRRGEALGLRGGMGQARDRGRRLHLHPDARDRNLQQHRGLGRRLRARGLVPVRSYTLLPADLRERLQVWTGGQKNGRVLRPRRGWLLALG